MSENEQTTELNQESTAQSQANLDNIGQDNPNSNNNDSSDLDNIGQQGNNDFYGAPETYDFNEVKLPQGFQINTALAEKFAPIGQELNLSQQGANKLVNLLVEFQQDQLANAKEKMAEYKRQEKETTRLFYEKLLNTDKEIGAGDNAKMNAYIDVADVGYNAFASAELKSVLSDLHLDYHPAVIKHFYRLGKLCGNDKITKTGSQVQDLSAAQILYGKTNNNEY